MPTKNLVLCFILLLSVALASGYENKPNTKLLKSELHERLASRRPIVGDPFHGQVRQSTDPSIFGLSCYCDGVVLCVRMLIRRCLFLQSSGGDLSLRRRDLKQTVDGDCYWNSKAEACHVNSPVLLDLLDDIDNPVSSFVHKELVSASPS